MARQLYLSFVEAGVRSVITLFDEAAPRTCETLWNALSAPVGAQTLHAIFAGPEIMFDLPESARSFDPTGIPNEHQTCFPAAGDCLWFYQGANAMKGLTFEMWEIGIFYGEGGRTFGPLGWTPVNIFGRITENLEGFAEACRDMRFTGAKTIEFGRLQP
jgi:hypothetical protein